MVRTSVAIAICLLALTADGQQDQAADTKLTDGEREFISLRTEHQAALDEFYEKYRAIEDPAKRLEFHKYSEPSRPFIDRLIQFEKAHHGTHQGLMAVSWLVDFGSSGGGVDHVYYFSRRQALAVVPDYANARLLPAALSFLTYGTPDLTIETALRKIIAAPTVTPFNRAFAQYQLATWTFQELSRRDNFERALQEIAAGRPLRFPEEKEYLSSYLNVTTTRERLPPLEKEAAETLEILAASTADLHLPGHKVVDDNGYIVHVDDEKSKTTWTIQTLADALLFRHFKLAIGKPVPPLEATLVNGQKWSTKDNLGNVIVIQFSFKGCGGCEAMYPGLREINDRFKSDVSIVSIMADAEEADTKEAVDSGKLTWNVHWDGQKGPIATRWDVHSFPTVYVVARDGTIAADNLRFKELTDKISELVKADSK